MKIIVAQSENGAIGNKGKLLVSIPSDMKHFKERTTGHTVIMGRKTLESFPGGRPLPSRRNIVMSTTLAEGDGYEVCRNEEELMDIIGDGENFVIGGGDIYELLLPKCTEAVVTEIKGDFEADTFIPVFAEMDDWELISRSEPITENGVTYSFAEYRRI